MEAVVSVFGTLLGVGWGLSGIAGWALAGGGTSFGTWRGALVLGPIALLIALRNE